MFSTLKISVLLTLLLVTMLIVKPFRPDSALNASQSSLAEEPCHLRYGWGEWRPLQYLNEKGETVGINLEFTRAVAKAMNCEMSFPIYANWKDLLNAIKQGEVDVVGNATFTQERAEFAYFSKPYRQDVYAIYVLANSYPKFASMNFESLKVHGFRLALTEKYIYGIDIDSWIKDERYKSLLRFTKKTEDSYRLLLNGEVDGVIEDPFVVSFNIRTLKIEQELRSLPIQAFGLPVSYMFSKKTVTAKRVEQFNEALENVLAMPAYHSIWMKPVIKETILEN